MARVTAKGDFSLDLGSLDLSRILSAPWLTTQATSYRATAGTGFYDEFRGKGFTYGADGQAKGGTITSYAYSEPDGHRLLVVEGIAIGMKALGRASATYSTADDMRFFAEAFKGDDTISGGSKWDVLTGFAGNDRLRGNAGDDGLYGGIGNDVMNGGAGADRLYGEGGADRMWGGAGRDTFVFGHILDSTVAAAGQDVIRDFAKGDRLDLSVLDADARHRGNQSFSFIGTERFDGKAGELRYVKGRSDTMVYADVDGDRHADFAFRLDDPVKLAKTDFLL